MNRVDPPVKTSACTFLKRQRYWQIRQTNSYRRIFVFPISSPYRTSIICSPHNNNLCQFIFKIYKFIRRNFKHGAEILKNQYVKCIIPRGYYPHTNFTTSTLSPQFSERGAITISLVYLWLGLYIKLSHFRMPQNAKKFSKVTNLTIVCKK